MASFQACSNSATFLSSRPNGFARARDRRLGKPPPPSRSRPFLRGNCSCRSYRSLEGHVFEHVREAGDAGVFAVRAHVHVREEGEDRRLRPLATNTVRPFGRTFTVTRFSNDARSCPRDTTANAMSNTTLNSNLVLKTLRFISPPTCRSFRARSGGRAIHAVVVRRWNHPLYTCSAGRYCSREPLAGQSAMMAAIQHLNCSNSRGRACPTPDRARPLQPRDGEPDNPRNGAAFRADGRFFCAKMSSF